MMQRVTTVWAVLLAAAGLVLIAALFLFGADLRRAATTGPRWKRRILAAALAVLSAAGIIANSPRDAQGGPVGRPRPTCYKPAPIRPPDPATMVRSQLAVLDKVLKMEKLDEAVIQRVVANIETAARALPADGPGGRNTLLVAEALKRVVGARALIEAGGKDLPHTPQWKRLDKTWAEAEVVAGGGKGPYPFDAAGKKALLADLAARAKDVTGLAAAGLLAAAESDLLKRELVRLAYGVQAKRPTEMKMATCYKPMRVRPAYESMIRVVDRAGLLRKLAEGDKLHPAAIEKILAAIRGDLATLADQKLTGTLSPDEQKTAAAASKAARTAINKIKALIKAASRETKASRGS